MRSPKAAGYLRVSHRNSAQSGAGLAAQATGVNLLFDRVQELIPDLTWHPKSYDHERPGHFCDRIVSAFRSPFYRRKAALAMLNTLKRGDHILVHKADRMFRKIADMAITLKDMKQRGLTIHFGDVPLNMGGPAGEMVLSIMTMMAEFESRMKSFRAKEAYAIRHADARTRGLVYSAPKAQARWHIERQVTPYKRAGQSDPGILGTIVPRRLASTPLSDQEPGRIFIYIRCSHFDSVESGLGLAWQEQVCRRFAEELRAKNPNLAEPVLMTDEAVSAWMYRIRYRPAGKALDAGLQRGDHVVFARLDRAFRCVRDCAETVPEWQERGVKTHFVSDGINTDDVWGQAIVSILSVFAALEPALTSARTREALAELRLEGRGVNSAFGFKWVEAQGEKVLVPDKEKIALMRLTCWLTARGYGRDRLERRIEELLAKRQGRKPIPQQGVFLPCAKEYIGDLDPAPFIPDRHTAHRAPHERHKRNGHTAGKYVPMICRPWNYGMIQMSRQRWPLVKAYLEQKRVESRQRCAAKAAADN